MTPDGVLGSFLNLSPDTEHTLMLNTSGSAGSSSSPPTDAWLALERVVLTVPTGGNTNYTYDDADTSRFVYDGTWGAGAAASQVRLRLSERPVLLADPRLLRLLSGNLHADVVSLVARTRSADVGGADPPTSHAPSSTYTQQLSASARVNFTGTACYLFGSIQPDHNLYSVTFDGVPQGVWNGSSRAGFTQQLLWFGSGFDSSFHEVVLTDVDGSKLDVDYIVVKSAPEYAQTAVRSYEFIG